LIGELIKLIFAKIASAKIASKQLLIAPPMRKNGFLQ
jgi:hypothetical protein